MARYKYYDMKQSMMIAVSLEEQLKAGTLEYAIHYLIEERIDTRYFDERFCNDETGRCTGQQKTDTRYQAAFSRFVRSNSMGLR